MVVTAGEVESPWLADHGGRVAEQHVNDIEDRDLVRHGVRQASQRRRATEILMAPLLPYSTLFVGWFHVAAFEMNGSPKTLWPGWVGASVPWIISHAFPAQQTG